MITRADVVATARKYVETPTVHQGRTLGKGVDCIGLIICVARDLGILGFDEREYRTYRARTAPGSQGLIKNLSGLCGEPTDEYGPGSILVMFINKRKRRPQHLAIASDRNRMIHAHQRFQRVVEHNISEIYTSLILCAFNYPGVE